MSSRPTSFQERIEEQRQTLSQQDDRESTPDSVDMYGEEDMQLTSHPFPLGVLEQNGHLPAKMDSEGAERQSSTDRSVSATPSQNGEDQPQELEDDVVLQRSHRPTGSASSVGDVQTQINDLKCGFMYMSHQMGRIMKALHVPPCMCDACAVRHQMMNHTRPVEDPGSVLGSIFPNATHGQLNALAELARQGGPGQQGHQQRIGLGYASLSGGGKMVAAPSDKKMVAEYARQHGAVAAAKRFGIPPPVSTYYQRKDSSNALNPLSQTTASPGPSSEGENDHVSQGPEGGAASQTQQQQQQSQQAAANGHTPQHQSQQHVQPTSAQSSVPPSPLFPGNMMDMTAMLKMNAAHATGSPGFLRGRGRGRPKLIGDELDADLVDYMVTVKQSDPHGHLTASQALAIAKQYILEKAPGLLEEHGGHVKLKLTWAMKLVSRIAERQKEMELGLPAGTLSNMGRHQLNNLPGGNFMADMMAQNIISQHMMMGMGGVKDEPDNYNNDEPHVGATPEIMNVKQLDMQYLTSLFSQNADESGEKQINDDDGEQDMSLAMH